MSNQTILQPLLLLALTVSCNPREAPPAMTDDAHSTSHDAGAVTSDGGDGELRPPAEVRFEVRPLGGPGSMGPLEVSPASEPALTYIRSYLNEHPEMNRLRIECTVSAMKMSSTPDPAWGAQLARQIARKLVAQGVDCKRLDPIGLLDPAPDAPGERVRFFLGNKRQPRPDEARVDPCEDR